MRAKLLVLSSIALAAAYGQIAPFSSGNVSMGGTNTQLVAVPPGTSPMLSNVIVDTAPSGGDFIDVNVGDPSVLISLIAPGGAEINAANAASFGFAFSTAVSDDTTSSDSPNPMEAAGAHTFIQFPAVQGSGIYQVKADASAATADTGMIVTYYSSSTVQAGAMTDSSDYRLGDLVIVSALLFDGTTPIQGAAVSATAAALIPMQATVGNYQLVGQQALSSTVTLYSYFARSQPYSWLMLTLKGSNITAYVSTDGTNWTQFGDTLTVSLDQTALFGLAVASGDNGSVASAVFDNVTLTGAP